MRFKQVTRQPRAARCWKSGRPATHVVRSSWPQLPALVGSAASRLNVAIGEIARAVPGVVVDHVEQDFHAAGVGSFNERDQLGLGAEALIDALEVVGPVAVVGPVGESRAGDEAVDVVDDRGDPDRGRAERGDLVELLRSGRRDHRRGRLPWRWCRPPRCCRGRRPRSGRGRRSRAPRRPNRAAARPTRLLARRAERRAATGSAAPRWNNHRTSPAEQRRAHGKRYRPPTPFGDGWRGELARGRLRNQAP